MNISPRERRMVLLAAVIGGAILIYLAVDNWVLPAWQRFEQEIGQARKNVADLTAKRNAARDQHYDEAYARELKVCLRLPTPEDAEQLFANRLNTFSRAAAMPTPSIDPAAVGRDPNFDVVAFNFKVSCTLEQFVSFLRRFYDERSGQRIEQIRITPPGQMKKTDEPLSFTMRISAVNVPPAGTKPPPKRVGRT